MAKKKKTSHKKSHHRGGRRMGSVHAGDMMHKMEQAGGLVLASMAGSVIARATTNINPKLVSLGQLGVGIFMTNSQNNWIKGAGYGLMGTGAIGLTHSLGMIRGVEDMMNGIGSGGGYYNEVNGISNNDFLNGVGGLSNETSINGPEDPFYVNPNY